jgi:hypothetical protein
MNSTSRFIPHAILATLAVLALSLALFASQALSLPDGDDDFNTPGFVVTHSWVKFAAIAVDPFQADVSPLEEEQQVARFFELNDLIALDERAAVDPTASAAARAEAALRQQDSYDERRDLENRVERILEGRLTDAIKEARLTRHVGRDIVWPPVAIEFEDPPAVLVRSPRDVIRKDSERLLQGNLPITRIQRIEAEAERDQATSALVVRVGAIATYPAIIPFTSSYRDALDRSAHEWMHHYLSFAPLGRRYGENGELTTLNETVANMFGREMACRMTACEANVRAAPGAASPQRQEPAFDFTSEMRGLRREVEQLLAQGLIDDAESLMEERRLVFVEHGYFIRRINQAYFAFHGSYADSAGSIDPIGPKLQDLRDGSDSLEIFIETARDFESAADLDAALGPG